MPLVARGIMKLDLKVIDTKQSFPPLDGECWTDQCSESRCRDAGYYVRRQAREGWRMALMEL